MFQSKGYFRNVTCPEEGTCTRPYCQLRHRGGGGGGGEEEKGGATEELRTLVRQTVRRMLSTGQAYGAASLARLDGEEIVAKVLREIQEEGDERPSYSPTPVAQLQTRPNNRTYGKNLRPKFQPHNSAHPSSLVQQENSLSNNIQHDSFNTCPGNEVYSSNSYSTNIDNDANSFYESRFNKNINYTEAQQHVNNSAFSEPTYLGANKQQNYNKQGDNWSNSNEQCIEEEQILILINNETSIRSPRKNNTSLQYDREKRKIHSDDDTRKKIKLDRGQPLMDMDTHLETSSEWNKGMILNQEHNYETSFPPLKKVRSQCDENTPTSTTEGWRRASEFLATGQKRNGLIRINPVPNVHAYLKNKTVKEEGKNGFMKEPPCSSETSSTIQVMTPYEERPLIKRALRKAHKPSNNALFSPPVLHEPSSRIPIAIRNSSIKKLFEELINFLNKELASEKAQRMELDVCTRISTLKPYKNAIALAVLRIRKNKGHECVENVDMKNQILTSDSVPVFTGGWSLYQCFEQYVMSGEEYKRNGYPMKHSYLDGCAYIEKSARRSKPLKLDDSLQRVCEHCCRTYFVDEKGFPTEENNCHYHWGKVRRVKEYGALTERYSCCDGDLMTDPCTTGRYHVSSTFDEDLLEGFVSTRPQGSWEVTEKAGIYGLDCEMCYTTRGVELARCTLVDLNGRTVYDKVVVPEAPILDYCTRFSGITEDMVERATLRLRDVQADLLRVVSEKTILVGHSLENDMKVLRLFHGALVDTSLVFPHKQGRPYKNSLRHLSKDLLNIVIQENESGHDSYEDANACIQIMLWKIKEDAKKRKNRLILSLEAKNNRAGE